MTQVAKSSAIILLETHIRLCKEVIAMIELELEHAGEDIGLRREISDKLRIANKRLDFLTNRLKDKLEAQKSLEESSDNK